MKLAALLLSFAVGVLQFALLAALLKAALGGALKRTLLLLGAKLLVYAGLAALLMLALRDWLLWAAVGYGAAVPLSVCAYLLLIRKKGGTPVDDCTDH